MAAALTSNHDATSTTNLLYLTCKIII